MTAPTNPNIYHSGPSRKIFCSYAALAILSTPTVNRTMAKITMAVTGASYGIAITATERAMAAAPMAI